MTILGGPGTWVGPAPGAGKTTLFNLISGALDPTGGRITYRGTNITHMAVHRRTALGITRTFQVTDLFPNLTVLRNLVIACLALAGPPRLLLLDEPTAGLSPVETRDLTRLLKKLDPAITILMTEHDMDVAFDFGNTITVLCQGQKLAEGNREEVRNRGNELSEGEQQMLAVARALFSNPHFMLMDEPTEGLAPLLVQEVGDVILKMKEGGMSILIVEQNLLFALRVSTETHLMSKGTIVYSSSPQELWANQEVKYQYLGV